jgi:hypothetical protein
LGKQGQTVLNLELVDLAMLHLPAESNEFDPRRV